MYLQEVKERLFQWQLLSFSFQVDIFDFSSCQESVFPPPLSCHVAFEVSGLTLKKASSLSDYARKGTM